VGKQHLYNSMLRLNDPSDFSRSSEVKPFYLHFKGKSMKKFVKSFLMFFYMLTCLILFSLPALSSDKPNLKDAMDNLNVISRMGSLQAFPVDADGNDSSGIEDVSYILQYLADLREYDALKFKGITISGRAINVDDPLKKPVPGVTVVVSADLDSSGDYDNNETFISVTDPDGYFTVRIPSGFIVIPNMNIITRAPGYSEFIRSYTDVTESFSETLTVSQGDFLEVNVAGIASGPARGGRKALESDQVVNIQLVKDRKTGRTTGRAGLGRFAEPPGGVDGEVLNVTFPLRGLKIPADSEKVYANVAYLDTVNNTGIMPGSFVSEGEGDTPVDMLQTFAASMIKVYDENGNELMDDPYDYTGKIRIKIAIPPETYDSLVDEDDTTLDIVEVPLYYFDEATEIWKLHRDENNDPVYGWLVDNFGNVLTATDLAKLKTIKVVNLPEDHPDYDPDKDGTFLGTEYQPGGVDSSEVTIFQVGEVNHFTNWNCDRAGRSFSYNFKLKDKYGNPIDPRVRFTKHKGGRSDDYSQGRKGKNNRNVHTYSDAKVDSLMKNFLSKDKSQRDQYLKWIIKNENPDLIQALMEGLRRYAINQRLEEQGETNELKAGIRRIFTNQMLTDAIINTNDLDSIGGIDCSKAPDLCKGALAQAAEQVGNASDAKKATAFLMQIAVDAYNPGKLDFEYALDKGIGMIELAANRTSESGELGTKIVSLVNDIKSLKNNIKSLYDANGNPPLTTSSKWNEYWEYTWELRNKLGEVKSAATTLGSRLNRKPLPRTASRFTATDVGDSLDMKALQKEALREYEDIGGLLYGAHKFSTFQWGYYQGDTFHPTAPPAGLEGGGEVGMLEYFDGNQWTPFPTRSDIGVDPSHIPVPNVRSYGAGSENTPMAYLGDWVLDMQPNVTVSGRVVDQKGIPYPNAKMIAIIVDNQAIHPDDTGAFSEKIAVYKEYVYVTIPGTNFYNRFNVQNNLIAVGDVTIPDKVIFNGTSPDTIETFRNTPVTIDARAFSLSGSSITYTFTLKKNYWADVPEKEITNTTGVFDIAGFENTYRYYVDVKATADSDLGGGVKPFANKRFQIHVKNHEPEITAINMSNSSPKVGDTITVSLDITDLDATDDSDDIRYRNLSCECLDERGQRVYVGTRSFDDAGEMKWHVNTDNSRLFSAQTDSLSCTLSAHVYDQAWGQDKKEKTFTLTQNYLPPEVRYNYLKDPHKDGPYTTTYSLSIFPGSVQFRDKNNDIVSYTLDSGKGDAKVTSEFPIQDLDPATPGRQGVVYDTPRMEKDKVVPYTFSYEALDRTGLKTAVTTQILVYQPLSINMTFPDTLSVTQPGSSRPDEKGINETDFDIVELPAGDTRSFSLGLSAATNNPDDVGDTYLTRMSYAVRYEPANAYYWQTLASGSLPFTDGKISGDGTIDVEISKPGKYYVFADATDGAGVSAGFSKIFYVSGDFDLDLTLGGKQGDDIKDWYLSSDTLNFQAAPLDTPDGFSASYLWEVSSDGGNVFEEKGTSATYSGTFSAGNHIVRMTLKNSGDVNQAPVVKTIAVTVLDPLNLALQPVDGKTDVALGDLHTMQLTNIPDGISISRAYWQVRQFNGASADKMVRVAEDQNVQSRGFVFTEPGTYIVSASVTDSRGVTGSFESNAITVKDYPPAIVSLTADTTIGPPPMTVTCTTDAQDTNPDGTGEVVDYIWHVTGNYVENGISHNVNERFVYNNDNREDDNPHIFAYPFSREGKYRISLTVEDNMARKSGLKYVDIDVLYRPPVISDFKADPYSGIAPVTVTLSGAATDIDSDDTTLAYAWDIGADGTIDSTSQSFTHTFADPGNYLVTLTVTDAQGLAATKTLTVYALPHGQTLTLNFRELWNGQLGNAYDFSAPDNGNEHYHEDSKTYLLRVGDPAKPVNIPELDAQYEPTGNTYEPVESSVPLVSGYNGFIMNEWGTLKSFLIDFQGNGTYDVGLYPNIGFDKQVAVTFPETYECGVFFYSNGSDTYDSDYADPGSKDLYLWEENSQFMNPDGQLNIIAKLGTKDDQENCRSEYFGFKTVDAWPIDETNPPEVFFDPADAIALKTVVIPNGHTFENAVMIKDGIRVTLDADRLDTYANGNVALPVVQGAGCEIKLSRTDNSNQTITVSYSAEQVANTSVFEPDVSGITISDFTISGSSQGADRVEVIFSGPDKTLETQVTSLSTNPTALENIGGLNGADTVTVALSKNYDTLLKYRKMPAANLVPPLDLDTFTGVAAPGNLTAAVDQDNKILTVTFGSDAPLCQVDVNVQFAGDSGGARREYHFIVPGSAGANGIQMYYPIPDMPNPYGEPTPVPGTDAIQQVEVTVSAIVPSDSYEGYIRNFLEKFDLMQWYLNENHRLLNIDAVNTSKTVWQIQ
jgi:PKD repeat protein